MRLTNGPPRPSRTVCTRVVVCFTEKAGVGGLCWRQRIADFALMPSAKRTIAILTGGGDVPGLNPAIRAITIRALREGYRVVGIRRGWAGLVDYSPEKGADIGRASCRERV